LNRLDDLWCSRHHKKLINIIACKSIKAWGLRYFGQ